MRGQPTLIAGLLLVMVLVRFGLAAFGYAVPDALMAALGAPADANPQMPYIVRVWAVRDMVLALLVLLARPATLTPLLIACIAIDATDVLSAVLAGRAGLFDAPDTFGLMTTAIAALVPETLALILLRRRQPG
ncbi:MAG: hypothetical protein CFE37_07285 [Alphaproteobacteria bacterium PA4]|nr:MAG: hypothetical protein CFE37_07285 [Alphaproteobacteria bacterium PA4]